MLATAEKNNTVPLPLAPFRAAGQNFHHLFPNKQLEEKGNFSPREQAAALAMIGVNKEQYLQNQEITHSQKSIATRLGNLFLNIAKNLSPKRMLAKESVTALAETDEGQLWTREADAAKLKTLLVTALADGKEPKLISQEGNLIKVIKVGDVEIKIIDPGFLKILESYQNYKIFTSFDGKEIKAAVNLQNDRELFIKIKNFLSENELKTNVISTPRLGLADLKALVEHGNIVSANLVDREFDSKAQPIDTINLYLRGHSGNVYYLGLKYLHPENNPYKCLDILGIEDSALMGLDLKSSAGSDLASAVEQLIRTKLKAFNEEYLISYS